MKITMVGVMSLDGKITKGISSDIYKWTSLEDQKHFFSQIKKNNLLVMGSQTYEAARDKIKLTKEKLRVILTRDPQKYTPEEIPNILEFSSDSPKVLVKKLEARGYKKMLLLGGGIINSLFLKSSLVNELQITIEPKIFGLGKNLVSDDKLDVDLKLLEIKKLNSKGTLLLVYKVLI
ncbi:MAG: dihydrofolate reductase [Candidatus Daviesbacteria bacterium]|nr:dihydrofolate reductase [Candidatus Daviesbacteria bacterium]